MQRHLTGDVRDFSSDFAPRLGLQMVRTQTGKHDSPLAYDAIQMLRNLANTYEKTGKAK
jgi:hypothetical protein